METKLIKWQHYLNAFEHLATNQVNQNDSTKFIQLNKVRQERWLKKGTINVPLKNFLINTKVELDWIVITETWCGDSAHNIPFIKLMTDYNPNFHLTFNWRDKPNSLIKNYLTDQKKAIPKLIVRSEGNDLFTWGPRPQPLQELITDFNSKEEKNEFIQHWYNQNKGQSLQAEILRLLQGII